MEAIDEFDDDTVVRVVTVLAFPVATLFGTLGFRRLHDVLAPLFAGMPIGPMAEVLGRRPVPLDDFTILQGFVLSVFVVWQLCFHRQRLARLYLIGIIAAILILVELWLNFWMTHLFGEEYHGERFARPSQYLAFIAIILLNSCLLAGLSVRLLGIRCAIWSKIRLAAFAWVNGGTILLFAQLAMIGLARGGATFS